MVGCSKYEIDSSEQHRGFWKAMLVLPADEEGTTPLRTLESFRADVASCIWWEGRHLLLTLMRAGCGVGGVGELRG